MAKAGRPEKVLIEAPGTHWGLGITEGGYTIEKFSASKGWVPVKWYGTLPDAAGEIVECTVRARLIGLLGDGVSRIKEDLVEKVLKEVSDVERRLWADAQEWFDRDERALDAD